MVSDLLANQRGIGQMPGAGSAVRGGACPDKSNLMLGIEVIEIHRQLHCVSGSAMVSQPGGPTVYLPSMAFMWERSEEHTSELQSLMRISYAVFCLKKKTKIPYN